MYKEAQHYLTCIRFPTLWGLLSIIVTSVCIYKSFTRPPRLVWPRANGDPCVVWGEQQVPVSALAGYAHAAAESTRLISLWGFGVPYLNTFS